MASAVSMALKERDPQRPYTEGSVLPVILLIWVVESVFSIPWPYIFHRRTQSDGKQPASLVKTAKMSFGVGFLVFVACGLIILGFGVSAMGVAEPSSGQESTFDQTAPFLMITIGIGLAVYICCNANTLDLNKEVESLFGWILAFAVLTVVPMILIDVYQGKFHCSQSSRDCLQLPPPLEVSLDCLVSLEGIAAVIWLILRESRTKTAEGAVGTSRLGPARRA